MAIISKCDVIGCDGEVGDRCVCVRVCVGEVVEFRRFQQVCLQRWRGGVVEGNWILLPNERFWRRRIHCHACQ